MNLQEAMALARAQLPVHARRGVILHGVKSYLPDEFKQNFELAMDALPTLTTDPNSGIPSFLTTMIDPNIFKILFSPNKGEKILGAEKKGTWLDETIMFPVVEHTGEVSSYGDFSESGRAGANTNFPQRQAYLFQVIKEYGERELERAGLAKLNWVTEVDEAAATVLNKFMNLTYFFGVQGLQNYGLLNDPNLSAALTPGTKAAGNNNVWVTSGNVINGTANEIYADIQTLFTKLVAQTGGLVEQDDELVLCTSPTSAVALTATNTFNVNVKDLLKKNFPNMRFETAVQYGALTASNPQGIAGGSLVQMYAPKVEGQKTGFVAFSEKMRSHPMIPALSSFKQKLTAGTWGSVIRMPVGVTQMLGV